MVGVCMSHVYVYVCVCHMWVCVCVCVYVCAGVCRMCFLLCVVGSWWGVGVCVCMCVCMCVCEREGEGGREFVCFVCSVVKVLIWLDGQGQSRGPQGWVKAAVKPQLEVSFLSP